jgi:CHAT domain-containing protein
MGRPARRLLAVDNPVAGEGTGQAPLRFSSAEVGMAAAGFRRPIVLAGAEAVRARLDVAIEHADVLHLSCHGRADPEHPLDSVLAMAEGERLSVRDVLERTLRVRLTVLSACETAIPGDDLPDEVIGFTSAFVQAGSAAAIATLWSVTDLGTAVLLGRFYSAWRVDGLPPDQAIRVAQRWLRDSTNGEKVQFLESLLPGSGHPLATPAVRPLHRALLLDPDARPDVRDHASPFHWAAFVYVGA